MTDHHQQSNLSELFIEQVKEVLESLYNFAILQNHPLASQVGIHLADTGESAAHALRRNVMEAIETLNPGNQVAMRTNEARIYNLMHIYYIRRMSIQEAGMEVGISRRQIYRDLRTGYEQVAAILWQKIHQAGATKAVLEPLSLSPITMEMTHLEAEVHSIDLKKLLEAALKAVQVLMERHNTYLDLHLPDDSVLISTNPTIAQQVLTLLLSQTIQQVKPTYCAIDLDLQGIELILQCSFLPSNNDWAIPQYDETVEVMMAKLRWKLQLNTPPLPFYVFIRALQSKLNLLIIDDNHGLIELLERYFADEKYYVMVAYDGETGLQLAQEKQPDAIIMDLMMPGMDGWELLQHLRTHTRTQHIPVIICSVINDPELAYSLGASTFVKKPISKESILKALSKLKL